MSDNQEDLRAAQMAAKIAVEILDRAKDGEKLISVTNHYPSGRKAFAFGFHAGMGVIFATCCLLAASAVIRAITKAVFP